MPSLFDQLDRLTAVSRSIITTNAVFSEPDRARGGPFTRAVLDTPLGDLIRDVDASEMGLFTLQRPVHAAASDSEARPPEVGRVAFPGATPLRRPPPGRGRGEMGMGAGGVGKARGEYEPEVYARAALKYLDRYQSIRPMPRARAQVVAILESLAEARENIKNLSATLEQVTQAGPSSSTFQASSIAEEEKNIQDLHQRIAELRKRKEALLNKSQPAPPRTKRREPPTPKPQPAENAQEDAFWLTPAAPARILRFTENLISDDVDLSKEMPDTSFMSPAGAGASVVPHLQRTSILPSELTSAQERSFDFTHHSLVAGDEEEVENILGANEAADDSVVGAAEEAEEEDDEDEDAGDATVVLSKAPELASEPAQSEPEPEAQPSEPSSDAEPPAAGSGKRRKKRSDPQMDRIAAKIWASMGETIMPGNNYDPSGVKGPTPPTGPETFEYLTSLSSESPAPSSPTSSSISSLAPGGPGGGAPTTQQVHIAFLLTALLGEDRYCMPLPRLKEALGSRGTRALYSCVAKKLVRIDRGGGEQIVMFDL
ncbi:hypothetical protein CONPUDRAFT_164227 [Coniophora puteana RWD-64-598 SS2]|uniref:Uncharacterized protein n=1 Tax=Coniophora puteana (strain RWD-64-598) TaxID=741705 RepID=A0A5M3MVS3_CONPW|nr:uncharacterized protein CONPUDRAFT_164227 [Coniophora puteana RWD-64-598 SS2]EIW83249.1 hypothetical protein CONPUDRAFT_164227 [Coniophora puteana RWD-64-598 SS2]